MSQDNVSLDDVDLKDPEHGISGQQDPNNRIFRYIAIAVSITFASVFLYTAGFGIFDLYVQRSLFLMFCLVLIFFFIH